VLVDYEYVPWQQYGTDGLSDVLSEAILITIVVCSGCGRTTDVLLRPVLSTWWWKNYERDVW